MSFTFIESASIAEANGSATLPFPSAVSAGDLLVVTMNVQVAPDASGFSVPAGYSEAGKNEGSDRTIVVYYKEADGSETSFTGQDTINTGESIALQYLRYSKAGSIGAVTDVAGTAASSSSLSIGPVTTASGRLLVATTRKEGSANTSLGFSNSFTTRLSAPSFSSMLLYASDKIAASSSESTTQTLSDSPSRFTGVLVSFEEAAAPLPTLRKGSQFTVEETLAGTVTSATLNGNAIQVDSHVGTTVTLTDTGSGITTSGEYTLVLTDDTAATESIQVQVNVYGVVPSDNPWQKEGVALASLTNVQYRVVAGSALNGTQLQYTATGTTDASGNIPTFDVSDTAAVVDDVVHIVGLTATGESIVAPETVELI